MHWQDAIDTTLQTLLEQSRVGVVTDVDGTISPIVPHPDDAQVTPRNRELLAALQDVLPLVAVVSGRAAVDIHERVGIPGLVYVGNHGLDTWAGGDVQIAPEARAYRDALETVRDDLQSQIWPGMQVEDKGATLSIHYRRADDPAAAAAHFEPIIQRLTDAHDLRLHQGRMVFEVRPPVDVNKGSAFRQLIERYNLTGAVYLGDDTTDADALRAARDLRAKGACYALALGVESDDTPAPVRDNADLMLSGIQDVSAFFSWLLMACSASST